MDLEEPLTDIERSYSLVDFSTIRIEDLNSCPDYEGFTKCIPNMTEEDYYDYQRFLQSNDLRYACEYDRTKKSIIITRMGPPSRQHEAVLGIVTYSVGSFNNAMSGASEFPLLYSGSSSVNVGTRIYSPDAQFNVPHRPCPNVVVESSDTQSVADLIRKLKAYIEHTDNIMFALGFKFLPVENGVALLAIGYSRENGTDHPLFVINFGSANVSPRTQGTIIEVAEIENADRFTGLGYGDAEYGKYAGIFN